MKFWIHERRVLTLAGLSIAFVAVVTTAGMWLFAMWLTTTLLNLLFGLIEGVSK